ncbi:MAG: signal peptidase II [Planctomycetota bacterium]
MGEVPHRHRTRAGEAGAAELTSAASDRRSAVASRAGRSPGAWALFVGLIVALLAADLGLKAWSFANVAQRPVALVSDAEWERQLSAGGTDPRLMTLPVRYANQELAGARAITLIPHGLSLRLTTNDGAVFGLGSGGRWAFVAFSVLATVVIGFLFWRSDRRAGVFHVGLALVLGGALGNLYDRLVYGVVRDMLHLFPGVALPYGWQWPGGGNGLYPWIFNLADVFLLAGVAVITLASMDSRRAAAANEATQESSS